MIGNTKIGRLHHGDIVGAIAYGQPLPGSYLPLFGAFFHHISLEGGIHYLAANLAEQLAIAYYQFIGKSGIQPKQLLQMANKGVKPPEATTVRQP